MHFRIRYFTPLLVLCSATNAAQECEKGLIPDTSVVQNDIRVKLAYLSTVDQQSFSEAKSNSSAGADVVIDGVPLSGYANYSDFSRARSRYFAQYSYSSDVSDASSFLSSKVSSAAYQAYSQCLDRVAMQNPGVHVVPISVSDDSLVVMVRWTPPPAFSKPARVRYSFLGIKNVTEANADLGTEIPPQGTVQAILARDPGKEVRVLVSSEGGYSDSFRIAPPPPPVAPPDCSKPRYSQPIVGLKQELRGDDCDRTVSFEGIVTAAKDCDTSELNYQVLWIGHDGRTSVVASCGDRDFTNARLVCKGNRPLPANSFAVVELKHLNDHCIRGENPVFTVNY